MSVGLCVSVALGTRESGVCMLSMIVMTLIRVVLCAV